MYQHLSQRNISIRISLSGAGINMFVVEPVSLFCQGHPEMCLASRLVVHVNVCVIVCVSLCILVPVCVSALKCVCVIVCVCESVLACACVCVSLCLLVPVCACLKMMIRGPIGNSLPSFQTKSSMPQTFPMKSRHMCCPHRSARDAIAG